ncbi:ADP-ribosylation factor GTPase-activating protein agd4 [Datura stramonium]|uniref:ADP-ribosylation factor GTPase-activating protein agd4 n=1 Tax=Datura stramonium TaxID=4076 RepID=A0ABS8WMH7_DATST|nr:ADP-ribosylation factor GTPase-activating protein agd4 [Datura stramonium]
MIIDLELPEYLEIKGKYKFYGLGWMSKAPGYYYPTMVREFYANYIATLEDLCKKGLKPTEMRIPLRILVRGEMVDMSEATITRMIYGPNFKPPISTTGFDYRMRERHQSGGPSAKVDETTIDPAETTIRTKSVGHAAQLPPSTSVRAIKATLELYKNLHARVDDMEAQVNDRLKYLIVPDLTRSIAEQKKAQDDIQKLQQERHPQEFSIPEFEELEEDVPFIDLLGKHPKVTLITSPPATEAVPPDTMSAMFTTGAIAEVPKVTPP